MKNFILLVVIALSFAGCCNDKGVKDTTTKTVRDTKTDGLIRVADNIITEVIVRPDSDGDPWETEKVAGYNGSEMVSDIFKKIYDGTLTVKDTHTGEALTVDEVKRMEQAFKKDNSSIGKLSFTEDWFYDPELATVIKKVKSVAFGYERYDNEGKVLGYKAIFTVESQSQPSQP